MILTRASITLARVNDGAAGKGVVSIKRQYYVSDSEEEQIGGSWSFTQPDWQAEWDRSKFVWERLCTVYTDGTTSLSDPVLSEYLNTIYNTVTDFGSSLDKTKTLIEGKVWQNDITAAITPLSDEITEISDSYSDIKQTLDSITSTVSGMQTTIDAKADGTTVTEISTQMAELVQDLSGFKTTVSETYVTQDSLSSAMSFAMSSISQQADKIALKVNKDGVISAINQSAEEITIDASKIDLSGYVTFTAHQGAISGLSNALSSVSSTANSAKAWTDENGTNMTALRSMVMKWTDNAVSTSTYIRGGWIATNTITAEKLAIGLNGNIITYGIDTFEGDLVDISGCAKRNLTNAEITDEYSRYGENSLKVITNGGSWCYIKLEGDDFGKNGNIPVTNGDYYVFSFYVRSTSHDSINSSPLLYKHSTSSETSGTSYVQLTKRTLTGLKSGWVRYISAPFKLDCNFVTIRLDINDQSSAVTAYFDCLQLERVENTLQTASPWKPNGATVIDGATIATGTIYATSIHANAITANKIAANAVTADKISVTDLYAIGATIGGFNIDSKSIYTLTSSYTSFELTQNHIAILYGNTRTGVASTDYRFQLEGLNVTSPGRQTAITLHYGGQTYFRSYTSAGSTSPGVTNIALINGGGVIRAGSSTQAYNYYWSFLRQVYFSSGLVGTVTSGSDKRIKHDIKPIDDKYISVFDKLEPVSYRLNDSPDKIHTGFIAQDLLSAMEQSGLEANDCAAFDDIHGNGTMLGINYSELIAIQAAKIKQLENKISKLEVKINENNGN